MPFHSFDPSALVRAFQERTGQTLRVPSLVADVLSCAYQCSLYREEAREIQSRILIIQDQKDLEHLDLLPFVVPLPLTTQTLRRLAFAAADSGGMLVADCRGKEVLIIGLATVQPTMAVFKALQIQLPPCEIALLETGVVELTGHGGAIRFSRDKIVIPALHATVPCAIPEASMESIIRRFLHPGISGWINYSMGRHVGIFDPKLFAEHRARFQAEAPDAGRRALSDYAVRLVRGIREIGVGGAVLILPSLDATGLETLMSGHSLGNPEERYRGELWNAGVLNHFEWLLYFRLAYLGILPLLFEPDSTPTPSDWIRSTGRSGLADASENAEVDAKRVAQLSAIDGGLVLNCLFRPLIFGTKFKRVDITSLQSQIVNQLMMRGMRHRSLAATVAAIPGSGGIVVSQDGDVTVFGNQNGVVCCHHEEVGIESEVPFDCSHPYRDALGTPAWMIEAITGEKPPARNDGDH